MQTKVIIAVVAVLLLGGGGYAVYTSTQQSADSSVNANTTTSVGSMMKSSMKGLLTGGKDVKCTFTQTTTEGTQSGTTYVAGGRMRSDMRVMGSAQGDYTMHVLNDGTYGYIWGGPMGADVGIKVKTDVESTANVNAQTQQAVDWDQEVDFNCEPWRADNSLLLVPTDVTFQDMFDFAGMMQGANLNTNTKGSVNANVNANLNANLNSNVNVSDDSQKNPNCSICDSLPSDAKKACKQSLGC